MTICSVVGEILYRCACYEKGHVPSLMQYRGLKSHIRAMCELFEYWGREVDSNQYANILKKFCYDVSQARGNSLAQDLKEVVGYFERELSGNSIAYGDREGDIDERIEEILCRLKAIFKGPMIMLMHRREVFALLGALHNLLRVYLVDECRSVHRLRIEGIEAIEYANLSIE